MRIFGRERQSLVIKKVKAGRAVFQGSQGCEEVEVRLVTEDGERLDLQISPEQVHDLIIDLTTSYQAIRPPLSTGSRQATWQGMDDGT